MNETSARSVTPVAQRVAVVVATYDHAQYLGAALDSVARQTRPVDEVIVVDDGSHDDPAAVAARFPGVRLIRQDNRGLSAARNAGLAASRADLVVFLDADDRLAPGAIAAGMACLAANPDAAFAYGAHRRVDQHLRHLSGPHYRPVADDPYCGFLEANLVGMTATAMFRREALLNAGGFDETLPACEDYDVFLRLARNHAVASHERAGAEYRIRPDAMSADPQHMLECALTVHARHRPAPDNEMALAAWRAGLHEWKRIYARQAWQGLGRAGRDRLRQGGGVLRKAPWQMIAAPLGMARRRLLASRPRVGAVDFGDFGTIEPISRQFGYDRGTPVDRYYIERFMSECRADIAGRVLEFGDAGYSRAFGGAIARQDVFHPDPAAPGATLSGDICDAGALPDNAFDCIVATQTLHLIHDIRLAVTRLHAALKPGGAALVTLPGVSSIDRGEWGDAWQWSVTLASARQLFGEVFGPANIQCEAYGNVYAATCFLQGLALEEVDAALLDPGDRQFPVIVTVRARRDG